MATYDHSVTAQNVIRDALLLIHGVGEGEAVSGDATADGLRFLNNMTKAWQQQGFHLWTRKEVTLFTVPGQASYSLGPSSSDAHWCYSDDFVYTLLNGAVTSSKSLTVDSTSGMAAGDYIGVETSSGRTWTTIKSVPSSTSLTVTDAITASDNATVFTYTSRPQRPLRILHARRGQYNGSDIPCEIEPLNEYFDQPNKTSQGTIVFVAYKPTLTSGTLYTWQTSSSVKQVVKMTVEDPLSDFDTVGDSPNFPVEWNEALIYNLAVRMEPMYGQLDPQRRIELRQAAAEYLGDALMFDSDMGSWYLQPDLK